VTSKDRALKSQGLNPRQFLFGTRVSMEVRINALLGSMGYFSPTFLDGVFLGVAIIIH